jgi:hypothetical protein
MRRLEQCPKCAALGNDTRGDNLVVYPDGGKHCFACKWHVWPKQYGIVNKDKNDESNKYKALLPFDFTREVPSSALPWLLQYSLPYSYWAPMLGYSPSSERLVFQVGQPTAFSIGRYVGTNHPGSRKWYVWGDCHKHVEVIGDGPTVVLVEDLISAHKVAAAGYLAVPLFGTHVHNPVIYYLLTTDKPVVLWLDNDQAFNVKKQALRLSSLIPQPVNIINTEKDPKCLSLENITLALNT